MVTPDLWGNPDTPAFWKSKQRFATVKRGATASWAARVLNQRPQARARPKPTAKAALLAVGVALGLRSYATVLVGPERRRRWTADDRWRLLPNVSPPGAVVTQVAPDNDVSTGMTLHDHLPVCRSTREPSPRSVKKVGSPYLSKIGPKLLQTGPKQSQCGFSELGRTH